MNITFTETISLLAFITAGFAVFYARNSANSSKIANQISLLNPKVQVYLELKRFQKLFRGYFKYPSDENLEHFYDHAVVMSELLFSNEN